MRLNLHAVKTEADTAVWLQKEKPQGQVHSVYRRVCNLLLNERLVVLAADGTEPAPDMLLLDLHECFTESGITVGSPVSVTENGIEIGAEVCIDMSSCGRYTLGFSGKLQCDWSGTKSGQSRANPEWSKTESKRSRANPERSKTESKRSERNSPQRKAEAEKAGANAGIGEKAASLSQADDSYGFQLLRMRKLIKIYGTASPLYQAFYNAGEQDAMSEMFSERLRDIRECIENKNIKGVIEKAVSVCGLGIGLTPSGDDFIAGLFLVLTCWEYALKGDESEAESAKSLNTAVNAEQLNPYGAVQKCRLKTNLLSARMIENAAMGRARQSELELIQAFTEKNWRKIKNAAHRVLAFGSSSGTDTALGILTGLEIVSHQCGTDCPKGFRADI